MALSKFLQKHTAVPVEIWYVIFKLKVEGECRDYEDEIMDDDYFAEVAVSRYLDKYIEYAREHNLKYDTINLDFGYPYEPWEYIDDGKGMHIFDVCNRHRQEKLRRNIFVHANCGQKHCNGWFSYMKRCLCGNTKGFSWKCDELYFPKFTIESTRAQGYPTLYGNTNFSYVAFHLANSQDKKLGKKFGLNDYVLDIH